MSNKIKNIIIIILISLLVSASIFIFILLKNQKEDLQTLELSGKIVVIGDDYAIIEVEEEDYLIKNIKGKYKEEDIIKVTYTKDSLNENDNPKSLKIIDEELIKSSINSNNSANDTNSIHNDNVSNKNENNLTNTDNQANNSSNLNFPTSASEDADTTILNYFNELETNFKSSTITSTLKSSFINVIDFLFYNGQIKGYTFSELSNSAKLKVLSLALYFDSKIDEYFPGYKESIINNSSRIYTNIKARIVKTYLDITTNICAENTEFCTSAKAEFANLKTNFDITWSLIKDIANDGLNNLKNWYEIWSGK